MLKYLQTFDRDVIVPKKLSIFDTMIRKYPIGLQSFREIREGQFLYIDKTELIHDLVNSGKYYFLSRPRRFGKSLLVDTIEELFSGSKELFDGLWVENHWNWAHKNPVLHFNFSELDYEELGLSDALKVMIAKSASQKGVTITEVGLKSQFKELIEKVSEQGKVVILIDEYDKPIIDYLDHTEKVLEHRDIMSKFMLF